jgi:hypothetical protein
LNEFKQLQEAINVKNVRLEAVEKEFHNLKAEIQKSSQSEDKKQSDDNKQEQLLQFIKDHMQQEKAEYKQQN